MSVVETQINSLFYVTGGTLSRDALCYVTRQADHELYESLRNGRFSYVLTARQMGKSSLMVRTASRLRDEGAGVVVLDLTAIGMNLTAEQWYGGLLTQVAQQLRLDDELEDFWDNHVGLGPLQRWMQSLRLVVLPRYPDRVVVFIDEIDAVRSLPFSTDEFFAAIREFYNHRTEDPELERLSFCLLGVAAPSDLIGDIRMTPFNIGQRIELHDFTEAEAQVLAFGLQASAHQGTAMLARILHWTSGHPYLTQRLCQAVAEHGEVNASQLDGLCDELFFARRAREQDDNLLFVRERMLRSEVELAGLLNLYAQVHRGKHVEDDDMNSSVTILKLSGIARVEDARLRVRNRIYERVFDQAWVAQNMPDAELRRQRTAYRKGLLRAATISAVILVGMASLAFIAIRQRNLARSAEETNRQQLYAAQMNLAARDWQASNIEHMREMLALQVPLPGQTDLRGFDWYLLWSLAHPDRKTLHVTAIGAGAFSPDLSVFATCEQTEIKIREMATGKQVGAFDQLGKTETVEFSRDGTLLAADCDDNSIRVWDIASNRELARFKGHRGRVLSMDFSNDGKMLATASEDQNAMLWDIRTGSLQSVLKGHTNIVRGINFSPDDLRVTTASLDETVRVWDVATGRELVTLRNHPASGKTAPVEIWHAAFSPDGRKIVAVGNFNNVAVWDAATLQPLPSLEGHQSWINAFAFSPDGKSMATSGGDRTIGLWDLEGWRFIKSLIGHGNQVDKVAFSTDGRTLASSSLDQTIKLWDLEADPNPLMRTGPTRVIFAPDGSKVATATDKEVKLWDATIWREIVSFEGHTARVKHIAYSPDGTLLASGSDDKTARLWDVTSGKERFVLHGHAFGIWGVAFSPDGKLLATGSLDKTVRLWDVATGEELATLEGHEGDVQRVAFSPDGKLLASTSVDRTVRLWNVATRREIAALRGHTSHASDVAFSPDGKWLATTSLDSTIKLWDVATLQQKFTLKGHAGNIFSPAFSPDSKRLATAGQDSTVRLWDVATGQELAAFHRLNVWSLSFSPKGKTLVSAGGDQTLRVWRAAIEQEVIARGSR